MIGEVVELLSKTGLKLVWFDSLGAKSSCISISHCGCKLVIDPGAAAMQPSYPLPSSEKARLREKALEAIERECLSARYIIVTHYHYDHHVLPSDPTLKNPVGMWVRGKKLILKNPNKYINESQWFRARRFLSELLGMIGLSLEDYLTSPLESDFEDPVEKLNEALSRDYGEYQERRMELLERGREWFRKLVEKLWSREKWVREPRVKDLIDVSWGDNTFFEAGCIRVRILEPWFHGVEYDRTGWVTPVYIEAGGYRIFYTSDLMGPAIEDYSVYIARLRPHIIIADGPPTYLYPYMLNRINLERAINNIIYIMESCSPKLIVYDHHLLREKKWRVRVERVFRESSRLGVPVLTAAECIGLKPLIDTL